MYLIATSILSISIPFFKINWIENQIPQKVSNSLNEIVLYGTQSNEINTVSKLNETTNTLEVFLVKQY